MLFDSNQGNYFENATACSKRTLKTTVATQLNLYFFDWRGKDVKSKAAILKGTNFSSFSRNKLE